MEEVLFNSRHELDRLPLGAVTAGTALRLGVRIAEDAGVIGLNIQVTNDDSGEVTSLPMERVWTENGLSRFEGSYTPNCTGLYWYHFIAQTDNGMINIGKRGNTAVFTADAPNPWQLTVFSDNYTTPDWIKGGVFYHIFVDRFFKAGNHPHKPGTVFRSDWGGVPNYLPDENGTIRNNDFFGGDLDGVIMKLPYLSDLGVTCIYLSPIFEAASNHKYDTSDYMKIDPAFGNERTLKQLCDQADELGIKIICDGVFNHTGDDSVYFDRYGNYGSNGAYNSKQSPYYPWFSFSNWPEEYESWWGIKTLPQVNEDNPEFQYYILGDDGVLKHWMRTGISGWRLDVADELPEDFLRKLRESVKDENPEALIIGEVWEDATTKIAYGHRRHYFDGSQLDAVMNYPFKNAIIDYLRSGNSEYLAETVETICENYPKPALDSLMNGLGTHDTARILTVLGGKNYDTRDERANARLSAEEKALAKKKLTLAAVLQCTLPGVPCIYYGDEAGVEGYEDPFNRRCYPWGKADDEIQAMYREIIKIRRNSPVFSGGEYKTLSSDNGVYAFMRKKNGCRVLVAINVGQESRNLPLDMSGELLFSEAAALDNRVLNLPPLGCAVVKL